MYRLNCVDCKSLQTHLENYKLIVDVNPELFDKNLFIKKEFPRNLELAQGYINESHQWEEVHDLTKSQYALTNAYIIVVEISAVIKHILYRDTFLDDSYFQLSQS